MTPQSRAVGEGEPKLLNSSDVMAAIRDLIVHLHRSNGSQAESIVTDIAGDLKGILLSGADPGSPELQRAQQTMFAIDEVRLRFRRCGFAARDAAKEWKLPT